MKPHFTAIASALAAVLTATAAVPVAWTNSPCMQPHALGPYPHGSTINFSVTLQGYTTPPIVDGADLRLWFQTNGMGNLWFTAPATLSNNVIKSTFGPAHDTGADRVSLFFGAPSTAFAAAVLRLSHAPGFTPNILPPPSVLDWRDELRAAMDDVPDTISNTVTAAYIEGLGINAGLTTNDVCAIVTNEVQVGWSEWSFTGDVVQGADYTVSEYAIGEGAYAYILYRDGTQVDTIGGLHGIQSVVDFSVTEITAMRQRITRNALGLARMEDLPSTNGMVTAASVTNTVRAVTYAVNDYVWDGDVCWRRQMRPGGYLEYVAVTNIDVARPENYAALEALERARRNQE